MNYPLSLLLCSLCPFHPSPPPPPTVNFPFSKSKHLAEVSNNMNIHDTPWTIRLLTVEHSKKLKIYLQNRPLESSET